MITITAISQGLFLVLFVVFVARALHGNAGGRHRGGRVLGDRLGVVTLLTGQAALYLLGSLVALAWLAEQTEPARKRPGQKSSGAHVDPGPSRALR